MSLLHRVRSTLAEAFTPASAGAPGFLVLLALVFAAPFPYGGVLPGGTLTIELLSFLAASLAFVPAVSTSPLGSARLPALLAAGVAGIGLLQLVPLPHALLAGIAPVSVQVYRETNAILSLFGRPLAPPRISIAPDDTLATALLWLAGAAAFCAAARVLATRARRRVFVAAVVLSALVQVAIGAAAEESRATARLHGAFINPDHLAGYLEIPLALAFGLLWTSVRRVTRGNPRYERRLATVAVAVLLWGTLAAGIGLTKSRGGILAALVTALLLLALSLLRHRHRRSFRATWAGAIVLAVAFLFAALITREGPLLRFLASDPQDMGEDMRVRIWRASGEAFTHAPLLGTGLGTFREAFRRVQPAGMEGLVEQAHDDFLQLLVTGGLLGALLGAGAYALTARQLLRGWLRQENREERMLALAAFGALVSLALHGVVDFNLSIPATAATLCAVAGAGVAAGRAEREAPTSSRRAPPRG